LARKYARIFVRGHYLFREASFEEQIMSKDKYPNIFSRQMEAIVFIILQIFFATRTVLIKTGEYHSDIPSFSWGIFSHVTRLDQSRVSENIWWIIKLDINQWYFRKETAFELVEILVQESSQSNCLQIKDEQRS